MSVIQKKQLVNEIFQLSLLSVALLWASFPTKASSQTFHTSPDCWQQPRLFHAGAPTTEFANRIHIIQTGSDITPEGEFTLSPNNAYRFWVREVSIEDPGSGAGVVIDVEQEQRPTVLLQGAVQSPTPRWLNEKLLYLRVTWGRIVYSDLIFDVEKSELVFHELVRDGSIAWQQFQQACQGRCPCVTESTAQQKPVPSSEPSQDDIIGLLELPTVFGPNEIGGVEQIIRPQAVAVYSEPSADAVRLADLDQPDQWAYREIGYEVGAAQVYEQRDSWYRVKINDGDRYGWVQASAGRFYGLDELLLERLAYLNPNWNGELWNLTPQLTSSAEVKIITAGTGSDNFEYPVEVVEVRSTEQGTWLHVRLLSSNGCDGNAVQIVDTGWVPAYSDRGALSVWYWSRGC